MCGLLLCCAVLFLYEWALAERKYDSSKNSEQISPFVNHPTMYLANDIFLRILLMVLTISNKKAYSSKKVIFNIAYHSY